jgi:hypothetical protein
MLSSKMSWKAIAKLSSYAAPGRGRAGVAFDFRGACPLLDGEDTV